MLESEKESESFSEWVVGGKEKGLGQDGIFDQ